MKTVKMLKDEVVSWGPQRLLAGEVAELPDSVADSLVGRSIAVFQEDVSEPLQVPEGVQVPQNASETHPEASEIPLLDEATKSDLLDEADKRGLSVSKSWTKDKLLAVLRGEG